MRIATVSTPNQEAEYRGGVGVVETLDHFEVPFFGRLANSFVDDE